MTITRQTTQQLSVNAPSLILVTLLMIEAAPRGQDTFWYKKKKILEFREICLLIYSFFFNHLQLWPKCTSLSQNDHILHCPRPAWHCVPERDTLLIPWLIINLLVKGHILDLKKTKSKTGLFNGPISCSSSDVTCVHEHMELPCFMNPPGRLFSRLKVKQAGLCATLLETRTGLLSWRGNKSLSSRDLFTRLRRREEKNMSIYL